MKYSFNKKIYIEKSVECFNNIISIIENTNDKHLAIYYIRKELGDVYEISFLEYLLKIKYVKNDDNFYICKYYKLRNDIVEMMANLKYNDVEYVLNDIYDRIKEEI